jgi:uncharacterized membrane protein YsdA (DUF1294 family)
VPSLVALILLLVLPAAALYRLAGSQDWRIILAGVTLISLTTYLVYAGDKRRARDGGRRTPEATLHLLELAGGWPAAFVAQRRLRHKSAKPSFQAAFWGIVLIHQAVAVDVLSDRRITETVFRWLELSGG